MQGPGVSVSVDTEEVRGGPDPQFDSGDGRWPSGFGLGGLGWPECLALDPASGAEILATASTLEIVPKN